MICCKILRLLQPSHFYTLGGCCHFDACWLDVSIDTLLLLKFPLLWSSFGFCDQLNSSLWCCKCWHPQWSLWVKPDYKSIKISESSVPKMLQGDGPERRPRPTSLGPTSARRQSAQDTDILPTWERADIVQIHTLSRYHTALKVPGPEDQASPLCPDWRSAQNDLVVLLLLPGGEHVPTRQSKRCISRCICICIHICIYVTGKNSNIATLPNGYVVSPNVFPPTEAVDFLVKQTMPWEQWYCPEGSSASPVQET